MERKCPLCAYSSDTIAFLHVHCINAHPKEFFTCPWCTLPFSTLRTLQNHASDCPALDKNEPREGEINTVLVCANRCLVCEGHFMSNEATIKHYKEQHLNYSYICDVCLIYFQHNSNLDVHYATCHGKSGVSTQPSNPSASAEHNGDGSNQNNMRTDAMPFNETDSGSSSAVVAGPSAPIRASPTPVPSRRASPTSTEHRSAATTDRPAISTTHKRQLIKSASRLYCCKCSIQFANVLKTTEHFDIVHGFSIFFCNRCSNTYANLPNVNRHAKQCKGITDNRQNGQNMPMSDIYGNENGTEEVLASIVVNQKTFGCHLCEYETHSRDMATAHLNEHMQSMTRHIKLENGNEIVDSRDGIKRELNGDWPMDNGQRPEPTFGGFVDLMSDDDEDEDEDEDDDDDDDDWRVFDPIWIRYGENRQ